ncbi:hypothetical protein [uncultured Corynebacterium sp.]|uniref:hypothetical protein n=1 Tax=uncultured Corynebacterium sp. TaxID=159447 RepID=UPI0026340315|nr:hypothetical protein [uncultured Corynebacterium sp.]
MKLGTIRMAGTDTEEHTTCAIILSDLDEAGRTPDTVQALPVPGFRDVASLLSNADVEGLPYVRVLRIP